MTLPDQPDPQAPLPEIVTCDLEAGDLEADHRLLTAAEQARAARFHFDRDRTRYITGRAFLRRQLGRTLGRPPHHLILSEGPWGKPALTGGEIEFNLSHSGRWAALALSRTGRVGLDLERLDRTLDLRGLAESCFTAPERAVLDGLETTVARRNRFFAFWTAKEAIMKWTGQGMSLPPLDITLALVDGWPVGCHHPTHLTPLSLVYPRTGLPDCVCCLAFEKDLSCPQQPPPSRSSI